MTESFAFDLDIPVSFNYNYDDLKAQIVEFAKSLVRPAKKSKTFDEIAEDDFEAKMLREPVEPYTVEELHARIDRAEKSIEEGKFVTLDEFEKEMDEFVNSL